MYGGGVVAGQRARRKACARLQSEQGQNQNTYFHRHYSEWGLELSELYVRVQRLALGLYGGFVTNSVGRKTTQPAGALG
jgi:hypothetical protein